MSHLISDLSMIAIFYYLATYIDRYLQIIQVLTHSLTHSLSSSLYSSYVPSWARYILWPMYWYGQGALMTGVWVLAHECGHESFSESDFVNNTVGTCSLPDY